MKKITELLMVFVITLSLFGCSCSHEWVISSRTEATCKADGKIVYTCRKCGNTYEEAIFGEHDFIKTECIEPTCTADGKETYTCSLCKETKEKTLKGGHDFIETSRVSAICTTDEKIIYTCSICNGTKEEKGKTGAHQWTQATCTMPKTCSVCGATEGEPLGHTTTQGVCGRCGKEVKNSFGSTVEFDELKLTFGSSYSFTKVNNYFSSHDGETVIALPVHIENIGNENNFLNMFYYTLYGSHGSALDDVSWFFEDEAGCAGSLRPGGSYDVYFYFLYDGNGTYAIEFSSFYEKAEAEFEIAG